MASKNKSKILELGNIYFFYRPRVKSADNDKETKVKNIREIQSFYMVLHAEHTKTYRLILIGIKKMPPINQEHKRNWATVDFVSTNKKEFLDTLNEQHYETKTRGERISPAVRPAGEGVYCIAAYNRNTYLAYILELPKKIGNVQNELEILAEATYVISVKNPNMPGKRAFKTAKYPAELNKKFEKRRFIPADPSALLDYEGAELLLISAHIHIKHELNAQLEKEDETINSADIFNDLKLWKKEHPITPLIEGKWA